MIEIFKKVFKFGMSGGVSALANLGSLFLFHGLLGIWYLLSSTLAFILSAFVNFYLQKTWVFQDKSEEFSKVQIIKFYSLALINLIVNVLLMYIQVDILGLNYMLAQTIVIVLCAMVNYFLYEEYIFKNG